jgi:mannitol/fructose-specific phosphotransferase system IIA component (Ntr-type)
MDEICGPELMVERLEASLRTDAIRELVELIGGKRGFKKLQVEEFLAEVLRRHDKTPCGLGRGLAFPNARMDSISTPCLAVGYSRRGLDCGGKDGSPAHIMLLYLGRATPSEGERAMLGRLSRAFANPAFAERLVFSGCSREMWEVLTSIDRETTVGLGGGKA